MEDQMNNKYKPLAVLAAIELVGAVSVGIFDIYEAEKDASEVTHEITMVINDKAAPAIEVAEDIEVYEEETQEETYYEPIYYGNSYWYESDDEEAEAAAKEWIAHRESGGDYGATNGRYIGRYQLDSSYLDGDYSEENQEAAAEAYIADRYGSWQAAQEHHREYGWY
jgi:hypothetical protein